MIPSREEIIDTRYTVALAMFAAFSLGAVAIQGLHAQAKPPVYQVVEVNASDLEAYVKDYAPKARAAITAAGGKILSPRGQNTNHLGAPPTNRIVIQQWDSVEKIQAYRDSAAFKDLLPLRNKLATFRSYAVEG